MFGVHTLHRRLQADGAACLEVQGDDHPTKFVFRDLAVHRLVHLTEQLEHLARLDWSASTEYMSVYEVHAYA